MKRVRDYLGDEFDVVGLDDAGYGTLEAGAGVPHLDLLAALLVPYASHRIEHLLPSATVLFLFPYFCEKVLFF